MCVAALLRQGPAGEDVRDLQTRLVVQGFDPGPADGFFGRRTEAAFIQYQEVERLLRSGRRVAAFTVVDVGFVAEYDFGLTVSQCGAAGAPRRWGPGAGPESGFVARGATERLRAFVAWVGENCGPGVARLAAGSDHVTVRV